FSSDAIPTHLLTAECGDLYRRHLQADGLLLLHISNQSLDLAPVARALGRHLEWESLRVYSPGVDAKGTFRTTWVIGTANQAFLNRSAMRSAATPWSVADRPPLLWTDDFTSLWRVLK